MIDRMEEDTQTQQPTAPTEAAIHVADISRPVSEETRPVATTQPTVAERSSSFPRFFQFRSSKHTLTSRRVLQLFQEAGLPRTARSIERYCKAGKLDAIYDQTRRLYFATPESVEQLIASLKQGVEQPTEPLLTDRPTAAADNQQTPSDQSQTDDRQSPTSSHDRSRTDATPSETEDLKTKVQSLEIDKRVRDEIINQLKNQIREDREHFTEKLTHYAQLTGSLETRLRLTAPREDRGETELLLPQKIALRARIRPLTMI